MKHDWYDPRYEEPRDPEPKTLGERFHRDSARMRRCRTCGARQRYELTNYDRLAGSTYQWWPLAGRCRGTKK